MQIELRYFADAREAAGCEHETLTVDDAASVRDVLDAACAAHPSLVAVRAHCRVALNESFADEDALVHDGATIALIPPVGGG